ncbi:MAG: hypothetical protein HY668_00965 [Chloroflexi bacterium]|nr:hypothetical protein [Chloroflexota bacterium]
MKKPSAERANEETRKALTAFEQAVESYREKAARYIYTGLVAPGKPMPRPEALVNFAALNEIDRAWRKLEQVEGRLRQAFIQLAIAHYAHFVKGNNDKPD